MLSAILKPRREARQISIHIKYRTASLNMMIKAETKGRIKYSCRIFTTGMEQKEFYGTWEDIKDPIHEHLENCLEKFGSPIKQEHEYRS